MRSNDRFVGAIQANAGLEKTSALKGDNRLQNFKRPTDGYMRIGGWKAPTFPVTYKMDGPCVYIISIVLRSQSSS